MMRQWVIGFIISHGIKRAARVKEIRNRKQTLKQQPVDHTFFVKFSIDQFIFHCCSKIHR